MNKVACLVPLLLVTACSESRDKKDSPHKKHSERSSKDSMDIVTLPSGLKYQILKPAPDNAQSPKPGSNIRVHYTGWLNNNDETGKKFDSSVDRGQPFVFKVGKGQVIKGWDEGLLLMKVGEKRRYYIPAALGYGAYGAGAVIPPNADLIFDVELLGID